MTMRTLLSFSFFAALSATSLAQQTAASGGHMDGAHADMNTERLVKELTLDQKQTAAVGEINKRYEVRFQDLKKTKDPTKEELRAKRRELFRERDAELQKVLNADQWKKLLELREQWKEEKKMAQEKGNMPEKGAEKDPKGEHKE